MAQVASAVTGREVPPVIERAEFLRPIIVPPEGSTTIRIAATVTDDDTVEVAIRSAETGFEVDHFRARLTLHRRGGARGAAPPGRRGPAGRPARPGHRTVRRRAVPGRAVPPAAPLPPGRGATRRRRRGRDLGAGLVRRLPARRAAARRPGHAGRVDARQPGLRARRHPAAGRGSTGSTPAARRSPRRASCVTAPPSASATATPTSTTSPCEPRRARSSSGGRACACRRCARRTAEAPGSTADARVLPGADAGGTGRRQGRGRRRAVEPGRPGRRRRAAGPYGRGRGARPRPGGRRPVPGGRAAGDRRRPGALGVPRSRA